MDVIRFVFFKCYLLLKYRTGYLIPRRYWFDLQCCALPVSGSWLAAAVAALVAAGAGATVAPDVAPAAATTAAAAATTAAAVLITIAPVCSACSNPLQRKKRGGEKAVGAALPMPQPPPRPL